MEINKYDVTLTLADIAALERGDTLVGNGGFETVCIKLEKPEHSATGAEIKDFWDNGWDPDYYHESRDAEVQIQNEAGEWILEDEKVYDLDTLGWLVWQGRGPAPTGAFDGMPFTDAFLQWKAGKK
jgi:hypothetical protein